MILNIFRWDIFFHFSDFLRQRFFSLLVAFEPRFLHNSITLEGFIYFFIQKVNKALYIPLRKTCQIKDALWILSSGKYGSKTAQKIKFSIKDFFSKMWPNPQFPADLITFTKEITFYAVKKTRIWYI